MTETHTSYLIGRSDRLMRAALEQHLDSCPLTLNEVTILSVLAGRPRLSNASLARRSLVTPQAMHKVVRSLESDGFIERRSSPKGGRSLETTITAKGTTLLAEADDRVTEAETEVLGQLDPDERRELHRLLTKVTRLDRAAEPGDD